MFLGTESKLSNLSDCFMSSFKMFLLIKLMELKIYIYIILTYSCFFFQEQYEFCYKVVQDFIDIFSDYANFK